jgi:acyl carrier protein
MLMPKYEDGIGVCPKAAVAESATVAKRDRNFFVIADSLKHIRLVLTVERQRKQRFPVSKIAELKNVGEFVALLKAYLR